jgi:hypothetical protein
VNVMLSEEDLARLLGEAAAELEVPEHAPALVLGELAAEPPATPFLRRRVVRLGAVAAALVAGVLVLQSLGGGGGASTQNQLADSDRSMAKAPGDAATGSGGPSGGGEALRGPVTNGSAGAPAPLAVAPGGGISELQSRAAPAAVPDAVDGARIVKTGSISLVVADGQVSATVGRVVAVAQQARGYVSDEKSTEFGDNPTSSLTVRVPVSSYESVVQAVRKVGGKVASAESSGRDVTAQYADTAAQIESLKAARSRFLTILGGARTIGETLSVQQRVDSVQEQIDRLEGQRRVLANQSSLATLTVTVSEQADVVAQTHGRSGLAKAWDDARHGFTSGVEALIAHSGRALLVLLVGAAVLLLGRAGWRLARRRLV